MLHVNSKRLVQELEALSELDGRFTDLKLVNCQGAVKRGNFSLVFRAKDKLAGDDVAIKFFDLDPAKNDPFRISCFDREQELLGLLLGSARCLQIISPLSVFQLDVGGFIVDAKYFVTEWYEYDIDEYFLRQSNSDAIEKLRLFNEVVLAVEALHAKSIHHRDVKADNFRRRNNKAEEHGVVAIDLGTAALATSPPLLGSYGCPVGFTTYSAPEAFCGLAGNRNVAHLTDIYALGCLLYELFSPDDYWTSYCNLNPSFEMRRGALRVQLGPHLNSPQALLNAWDYHAPIALSGLTALKFDRQCALVPFAVIDIVNDVLREMTVPNFRYRRITLPRVRERLWCAIRCLKNASLAARRAKINAEKRAARREKARKRGELALLKAMAN